MKPPAKRKDGRKDTPIVAAIRAAAPHLVDHQLWYGRQWSRTDGMGLHGWWCEAPDGTRRYLGRDQSAAIRTLLMDADLQAAAPRWTDDPARNTSQDT